MFGVGGGVGNQISVVSTLLKNIISDERIFELATEAGADECTSNNEYHEIQCKVNEIYSVKKELERIMKV